ncbi:MAG: sigma 54-interacting transcriptional regulator [Gemmatimonadales bacterium]
MGTHPRDELPTVRPAGSVADAPSAKGYRVLAICPDAAPFRHLTRFVESNNGELTRAADQASALRLLSAGGWDLVVPVMDEHPEEAVAWWAEVVQRAPGRPRLVALTRNATIGLALRAAQLGVLDVLSLPVQRDDFMQLLKRVRSAANEVALPLPEVEPVSVGPYQLVAQSAPMLAVYRTVAQVAPSPATVLILGESGTGKELIARAIHVHGPRAAAPIIAVNCAAIPENLLESELFGHEKGAFTGAVTRKIGRFERANGGTLFLDEIADMSLVLQSKILRAVQEREIERVGGHEAIAVDVRLIAATNRDLRAAIAQGRFREDLYYRLAVVSIQLPTLADRGDDLVLLAAHFARAFGARCGKGLRFLTDRALDLLRRHEWVGNVRELRNVIERAVLVADGDTLRAEHLPEEWRAGSEGHTERTSGPLASLQDVEARHIARVLAHTGGQIGEASRILAIHRNTLARKIREYRL